MRQLLWNICVLLLASSMAAGCGSGKEKESAQDENEMMLPAGATEQVQAAAESAEAQEPSTQPAATPEAEPAGESVSKRLQASMPNPISDLPSDETDAPKAGDVIETESGLVIEIVEPGSGAEIKKGDSVKVHYTGKFENGEVFDSSHKRNQPFTVRNVGSGSVIKGWEEGLQNLRVGSKAKLTIPPDLGYGSRGMGPIPGNSTLYFDIEVLDKL